MKIKVLFVSTDTKELEKRLNNGWETTHMFQHPKGCIFVLRKNG